MQRQACKASFVDKTKPGEPRVVGHPMQAAERALIIRDRSVGCNVRKGLA